MYFPHALLADSCVERTHTHKRVRSSGHVSLRHGARAYIQARASVQRICYDVRPAAMYFIFEQESTAATDAQR